MVALELSLLLLALPVAVWGIGALAIASGYADLRSKGLPVVKAGSPGGRLLQYFVLTATHAVFGLVLWLQMASLEAMDVAPNEATRSVLLWTGVAYAWVAGVAIVCQVSTARIRLIQLVGEDFGRVLILLVVWNTLTVFGLLVAVNILGVISAALEAAVPLAPAQADQLILAVQGFAISAAGAPVGTVLSARIRDVSVPRNFVRAIARTEVGTVPLIAGLLWALLSMAAT